MTKQEALEIIKNELDGLYGYAEDVRMEETRMNYDVFLSTTGAVKGIGMAYYRSGIVGLSWPGIVLLVLLAVLI